MIEKETIDLILDYLFWLATAWLTTFLFLTIFSLSTISGQMTEYKIIQVGKLFMTGVSVDVFVWFIRGIFTRKWWY